MDLDDSYNGKFKFSSSSNTDFQFNFPEGKEKEDEFFGKSSILRKRFEIKIETKNLLDLSNILIKYQGCSDAGICYPLQNVKLL